MTNAFALISVCAVAAMAQDGPSVPWPHTISTHATAHRRLPNTVADVSVGIETEGATVTTVTGVLGSRSQKLIAFLKREGADRLITNQIGLEPKVHTPKGGPDHIVGYTGTISVSFRANADKVSDLITGALSQGANTLQQISMSPSDEKIDRARDELAGEATRSAMAQAESVAKAAGERIISVREIVVDPQDAAVPMFEAFAKRAAPAKPMQDQIATVAGEQDVKITVNLWVDISASSRPR